jgi:hypothetical protein
MPFITKVRGVDAEGKEFTLDIRLSNLSTGGLYLQLPFPVNPGEKLLTIISLTTSDSENVNALQVAAHGRVVRLEPQPNKMYGVGVSFTHYRYIFNA